jgi:hypothetical protein
MQVIITISLILALHFSLQHTVSSHIVFTSCSLIYGSNNVDSSFFFSSSPHLPTVTTNSLFQLSTLNFKVTLQLTVRQSVCLGIEHPCGTCDQILLPIGMLLSEICGLVSVGCNLQCNQWLRRIRNHTLLSHLRLPQPGGPGSCIYIPQEQGGPVIPLGIGFSLRHLLRLAGLL